MTVEEMIDGARCLDACVPDGIKESVLVYLFGQQAGVSDVPTMISGATCIDGCIPDGMKLSVFIAQMSDIAA